MAEEERNHRPDAELRRTCPRWLPHVTNEQRRGDRKDQHLEYPHSLVDANSVAITTTNALARPAIPPAVAAVMASANASRLTVNTASAKNVSPRTSCAIAGSS